MGAKDEKIKEHKKTIIELERTIEDIKVSKIEEEANTFARQMEEESQQKHQHGIEEWVMKYNDVMIEKSIIYKYFFFLLGGRGSLKHCYVCSSVLLFFPSFF